MPKEVRSGSTLPSFDTAVKYVPVKNSSIPPLGPIDYHEDIADHGEKLLKAMQKREAEKVYYKDTQVSLVSKGKSPIDTSSLPKVAKTIDFFENLTKPVLPPPEKAVTTFSIKGAADKGILDNLYDWFIKPIKDLIAPQKEVIEESAPPAFPMSEEVKAKLSEYYAKLEEHLESMKEAQKEDDSENLDTRQREIRQYQRWMKCIKTQLQAQEEHMAHIVELISHKQSLIEDKQREHHKIGAHLNEKEEKLKPLNWINTAASSAQIAAAALSGALLLASFCVPGLAIPSAIGASIGVFGGAASLAQGGSKWMQADVKYEMDQLLGQLQKWREEEGLDTQELEETMKELTEALSTVTRHWEELAHIVQVQDALTKSMMRNF